MAFRVSAYIPCFNNRETIQASIRSIKEQSVPVDELFVVDDGSTDGSVKIVESLGVRVIQMGKNQGRGAVRARAVSEAQFELVLSCDATVGLEPKFLEKALPWFSDANVAGVFGWFAQKASANCVDRWRARHLFKNGEFTQPKAFALLITGGALVRKQAIVAVGNFDADLRHSEDAELGRRLLAADKNVVHDPRLEIEPLVSNALPKVLERYWRWHAGTDEAVSVLGYLKQISYSVKVMARKDLAENDPMCVPISLLAPHYQFWRSYWRTRIRKRT